MRIGKEELQQTVVRNQVLKNLDQFKYLESLLTKNTYCTKETRSQIAMAKPAITKKRSLMTRNLSLDLQKKLLTCYIGALIYMNWKHGN